MTVSCEDSEVGFKIFGGFRFVENFGVEAGFGRAEGFDLTFAIDANNITLRTEYQTFYLLGVGALPIGDIFALTGKVGFHAWDYEASGGGLTVLHVDGTDPLFGVGGEFRPTENFVFHAEWLRLLDDYDDVDTFSGGIAWAF